MDERMTELEIKVAYLERTLEDLDGVVRGLGDKVELLTRELKRLRQREQAEEPPHPSEKPPHY